MVLLTKVKQQNKISAINHNASRQLPPSPNHSKIPLKKVVLP